MTKTRSLYITIREQMAGGNLQVRLMNITSELMIPK